MNYHLICVRPFGKYTKGQIVTDQDLVKQLRVKRDAHFVKVHAPADATKPETPSETDSES